MSEEYEIGFQFLAENSTDVVCRAGLNLVLNYSSPSCFQVLGWRPEEMTGVTLDAFVIKEDASALAAAFAVARFRNRLDNVLMIEMTGPRRSDLRNRRQKAGARAFHAQNRKRVAVANLYPVISSVPPLLPPLPGTPISLV